jgi:hypothetical protein
VDLFGKFLVVRIGRDGFHDFDGNLSCTLGFVGVQVFIQYFENLGMNPERLGSFPKLGGWELLFFRDEVLEFICVRASYEFFHGG